MHKLDQLFLLFPFFPSPAGLSPEGRMDSPIAEGLLLDRVAALLGWALWPFQLCSVALVLLMFIFPFVLSATSAVSVLSLTLQ